MLHARRKTLLFKRETTYGTDAVPVIATDAILAHNVRLEPMAGEDVARELDRPYMAADETAPANLHMKLMFDVELAGGGTAGTPPRWGPLMRACGAVETVSAGVSVTYSPGNPPHDSGTGYIHMDGVRWILRGSRGKWGITLNAQGLPRLGFEMAALYSAPADTAFAVGDVSGFQKTPVATSTNTPVFTIGGYAAEMKEFGFDSGQEVVPRFLIGSEQVIIAGRSEKVTAKVNAKTIATFNPQALAAARTPVAMVLQHGTVAGRIATLNVPNLVPERPRGLAEDQGILMWDLSGVPQPSAAGNDQWSLVLS